MAERRMFAKTIIDSDAFIDMPVTARLLYYDLGMRADDDGFVNSPKKIIRMISASEDDLKILIAKKFVIPFESGVVVIKAWRINNSIRRDTYNQTKYKEELAQLVLDENGSYKRICENSQQRDEVRDVVRDVPVTDNVTYPLTQVRLGKDRLGKDSIKHSFIVPTVEEVSAYCAERNNNIDPEKFVDYYTANGWQVGKTKMKDWKAAVRTWERNDNGRKSISGNGQESASKGSGRFHTASDF